MGERRALAGWGRTAATVAEVERFSAVEEICAAIRAEAGAPRPGARGLIARGQARSYGDAAQNAGGLVLDMRAHRWIGDPHPTGVLSCGAGATLASVIGRVLPHGWFLPVTPGTREITVGGAVSADVHGKNHRVAGSFADHVLALQVVDGRGEVLVVERDAPLFRAICGGMGLAGVVVGVTLRLSRVESAWMLVDTVRTGDLDATLAALQEAADSHEHAVAWVDCLAGGPAAGRGVVTGADHAPAAAVPARQVDQPLRLGTRSALPTPPWVPRGLLSGPTIAAYNEVRFRRAATGSAAQGLDAYFYPLDGISGWNRLYGPRGLVQYQFLVPDGDTVSRALAAIRDAHAPGFLGVIKRLGAANAGLLSFPQPGWTVAVDFPAATDGLAALLDTLDGMVAAAGGRVYLAKDARLRPELLATMYPHLDAWRELRARADPHGVFRSDLARRLSL